MLYATMLLITQVFLSGVLIGDQDRPAGVVLAQGDKPRVAGPAARGGRRGKKAPEPVRLGEVRLFRLKHAECHEVTSMLSKLLDVHHLWADLRTNSVIFVGPAEEAAKIEEILATLDTPTDDARAESELSVVAVRNRDVHSLAKEIDAALGDSGLFGGGRLNIAADRARSKILLDGQREAVLKAESIIKELDSPPATANLEFAFFKARLHATGSAPEIPEDLRAVAEELGRFGQVELLGRLSTIAVEQEGFQVAGAIADMIEAEVGGHLLSAAEDGLVKISLTAEMDLYEQGPTKGSEGPAAKGRQRRPGFHLKTVVLSRRGDFMVLGTAPNGWEAGESAILVLHVPQ